MREPLKNNGDSVKLVNYLSSMLSFVLLLLCSTTSPALAKRERVLHEPLFPIQWTPPPPSPEFSDPSVPTSPDLFFPPSPPSQTATLPTPTTAADVSSQSAAHPSSGNRGSVSVAKTAAIATTVSIAALLLVSASCFVVYKKKSNKEAESRKLIGNEGGGIGRLRSTHQETASDLLYLGTVEPGSNLRDGDHGDLNGLNGSPYRKLGKDRAERVLDVHVPSPELRPLPPLRRISAGTLPRVKSSTASSDEDTSFYYTPHQRSMESPWSGGSSPAGISSRRSLPSMGGAEKEVVMDSGAAAGPVTAVSLPPAARSRRTPPRTRFSTSSVPDVKQMIAPPPAPAPPPPPPPAPLVQTFAKMDKTTKVTPPPPPPPPPHPPPPPAAVKNVEERKETASEASNFTPRRRLMKPLPAEGTRIDMPSSLYAETNSGSGNPIGSSSNGDVLMELGEEKPKLKPLHWDKVKASSDRAMVWDQLKSSSFQ